MSLDLEVHHHPVLVKSIAFMVKLMVKLMANHARAYSTFSGTQLQHRSFRRRDTTQGPSWGYLKVNFSETLSIFGDRSPRNGSKNGEMAPRTGTGCPRIGPFVGPLVVVRTSVSFLSECVVCEKKRDPSRTTTAAGGLLCDHAVLVIVVLLGSRFLSQTTRS